VRPDWLAAGDTSRNRDRDAAGRPRSARPRDGLGRPLDRDAAGEPLTPENLDLTAAGSVTMAQRLIEEGRPFHAHEVLEAAWKAAPETERELWRGLAQIAVGLTHARRGNGKGAVTLLRRGAESVRIGAEQISPGPFPAADLMDPQAVRRQALDLAARIEQNGLRGISDADLRLPLTSR
jgi:uncharacterized protein